MQTSWAEIWGETFLLWTLAHMLGEGALGG